jgi:hypothetical protein
MELLGIADMGEIPAGCMVFFDERTRFVISEAQPDIPAVP